MTDISLLRPARRALGQAKYLLSLALASQAEAKARRALRKFRSALDWLEDSDGAAAAHEELDAAGRWVRETFGCWLTQTAEGYEQDCPVALAHVRVGLSPEIIIEESECSVCKSDFESCGHIPGHAYDDLVCAVVHTKIRLRSVALVARPRDPDARIESQSVPLADLRLTLGPSFQAGQPVSCDFCLQPCGGLREIDFGAQLKGASARPSVDVDQGDSGTRDAVARILSAGDSAPLWV